MEYQNKYSLSIGLTTKNNRRLNVKKSIKTICNTLDQFVSGYNITKTAGFWGGIREKSIKVDIIINQDIDFIINQICNILCYKLQQNCILVEKNTILVDFIGVC